MSIAAFVIMLDYNMFHGVLLPRFAGERLILGGVAGDVGEVGAWMSVMTKAHDLALTRESSDTSGRLHHVAYEVQNR